ncbi:MAG: hypothetical protein VXZ72_02845, partial [Chlamydiota bacterium]|nr:hypothetical protein [Chlamydiota bacterium]
QQIAEQDEPRAIILDFLQRTILVHPPAEDGVESSDFTADSLAFLLTSGELEHTALGVDAALKEFVQEDDQSWVCAHPNSKDELSYEGEVLWTKMVEPEYLLLVTRSLSRNWRVIGMSRQSPKHDT